MSGRIDVQFLSVNHNKYIPYPHAEQKLPKQMPSSSSVSSSSAPRSSKLLHAFDLLSISDQLPPNTGPPGTVPVNGSNSSATSNKNLSHVPCKFYRQGICQAGNLCPFSHNLDGTLAADKLPCKYFQKGNCKFGLKCALAHFLPDGTRVNSKGLLSYRRNNDRGDRSYFSGYLNGSGSGANGNHSANTSSSATPSNNSGAASAQQRLYSKSASTSSSNSATPVAQPIDISANSLSLSINGLSSGYGSAANNAPPTGSATVLSSVSSHMNTHTSATSGFGSSSNNSITLASSFSGYNANDWLMSSHTITNPFSTSGPKLTNSSMMRSLSSNSPPNFMASPVSGEFNRSATSDFSSGASAFHSPQTQYSTPYSKFSRYQSGISTSPQYEYLGSANDSAVVDDDSEGNYDNDDNAFLEDFVPASLGNLILTPQERQRRDSRSQSGTLLVRPNLMPNGSFEKRTDKKLPGGDYVFLME